MSNDDKYVNAVFHADLFTIKNI